jgi:uncharacterized OB-fold protein
MERVPIKEGFFTVPEDVGEAPKIIGTKCADCGERFFPSRTVCARCNSRDLQRVEMSGRGRLYSYTFVHMPMFGATNVEYKDGYGVGQVDLTDGPRLQVPLAGPRESFDVGMELRAELDVVRQDKEGRDVVSLRFRKLEDAS